MVGSLKSTGPAKTLEAAKPYKVVNKTMGSEETIWAHHYVIIDGCLQFVIMKTKEIDVDTPDGKPHKHLAVYQTFPKAIAKGQWTDVEEVFVPTMPPNTMAN